MSTKTPCLNCQKRQLACHSTCEDYKKYKESRPGQKSAAEIAVASFWVERKMRMKQRASRYKKH